MLEGFGEMSSLEHGRKTALHGNIAPQIVGSLLG
jgi:hypothetical protein